MDSVHSDILRYLGYKREAPGGEAARLIAECESELLEISSQKYTYRVAEMTIEGGAVRFLGHEFKSANLCRHLNGCEKLGLMAVTLGADADMRLVRYSKLDMTKAVVFDAALSAYTEAVCDTAQEEMMGEDTLLGLFPRTRFSPGYGDFPLEYQRDILTLLDARRQIGLTLSDSLMLVPTKSVTAVVGFSRGKTKQPLSKCETCGQKDVCGYVSKGECL